MDSITILLALGFLTLLYYYLTRGLNLFKNEKIHHMTPLPLFGNMAPTILQRIPLAHLIQRAYNVHSTSKYVGFYDFLQPVIMIRDPDLIKTITVKNFESFMDHRVFVDASIDPLFGKNLFSLHGERWKEIRALLSPAFTSSKMKSMFKLMNECGLNFVNFIVKEHPKSCEMELKNAFSRYTNDVIATCAFGINVDSMKNPTNEFYVYGKEATTFGTFQTLKIFFVRSMPLLSKVFGLRVMSERVTSFFSNVIERTIHTREEKGITRPDMIQLMMESKGKTKNDLTIEDMTSQAFLFFFGGFDTISNLMCFVAYELAVHPEIQETLRNEVDEVVKNAQNGEQPSYEAVNGMKYLDAVINEALRLHPIAAFMDRMCQKEFQLEPDGTGGPGFSIQPGMVVWVPVYALHRDPKYYPDPDKFDPKRFLEDQVDQSVYMPFGMGPRMCIGNRFALLETKVLLFHLISKILIEPCSRTSIPLKLDRKSFVMTSENGFWMKFVPRKL